MSSRKTRTIFDHAIIDRYSSAVNKRARAVARARIKIAESRQSTVGIGKPPLSLIDVQQSGAGKARVFASASHAEVSTNGVCIINELAVGSLSLPPRGQVLAGSPSGRIACVHSAARATYAENTELFRSRAHTRLPPPRNSSAIDSALRRLCVPPLPLLLLLLAPLSSSPIFFVCVCVIFPNAEGATHRAK